jgi:hypothetical protein
VKGFAADLAAAERLCTRCGLSVGSIDFIGEGINEINGCGNYFYRIQALAVHLAMRARLWSDTSLSCCRRCNRPPLHAVSKRTLKFRCSRAADAVGHELSARAP